METLEKYQRLKAEFKKLKEDYKSIRKNLESECNHTTMLEAEILDINTKTMKDIIENNRRFNLN